MPIVVQNMVLQGGENNRDIPTSTLLKKTIADISSRGLRGLVNCINIFQLSKEGFYETQRNTQVQSE